MCKLRQLRLEKGISTKTVIQALNISHCTYYKKELGKLRFSLIEAKKISEILEMNIEDIFFDNKCSEIELN